MARQLISKNSEELEKILKDCLDFVKISKISSNKVKLLLRLFLSKLGYYFFLEPDNVVNIGFMKIEKSPAKDELFKVTIIRHGKSGIVDAKTLLKFYTGELQEEKNLKETLTNFLSNLIDYAQEQEIEITNSINLIEKRKENK